MWSRMLILGVILLLIIAGTVIIAPVSYIASASLYHDYVEVDAQDYQYVTIYVDEPNTTIFIKAYILTSPGILTPSESSDIDIELIRPDGSIQLAKQRYQGSFDFKFTASMTGAYKLLLDNSYSILTNKYVDLAIADSPPPKTVTHTITHTYTKTLTNTETSTSPTSLAIAITLLIVGLVAGFFVGHRKVKAE